MRRALERAVATISLAALAWTGGPLGAAAQAPSPPAAPAPAPDAPHAGIDDSETQLQGVQDTIKASEDQRRRIEAEIESMRNDRARLTQALIDTTARARDAEAKVADVEKRLDTALASEAAIRRSLEGRRDVIAEVLAALQRLGRRPPPAVLASPDDILKAVRTSMLLGAVVPELRAETEALASDLADLVRARQDVAQEREALARESAGLANERQRVSALIEARQSALVDATRAYDSESAKIADLARRATDLKDLIARMEREVGAAAHSADAARQADEAPPQIALGPTRDPARLAPAISFAAAKGALPLPVVGALVKSFGAPDGFGGVERGLSFATRPGAIVSAPCDGWISYSGPWRSFGQLLIVNAGGGYYVVLAGMTRINVAIGQFILAGEPVASMGDGSAKTAAAVAIGATQPVLYVEFRKDGAAIDPGPWWAKPDVERVRG